MRTATPARAVVENMEERTLMSAVIYSQHPAMYMPESHGRPLKAREVSTGQVAPGRSAVDSPRNQPAKAPTAVKTLTPQKVTAVTVGNTVKLAWQKVPRAVDTIVLDYSNDGGTTWQTLGMLGKNAVKFTAEGLESGKTYQFKLWTMHSKGVSPASSIVSAVLG